MDIEFRNKKLRELCEKRRIAEKKLGSACARKLQSRLDDIEAANRVTDLPSGNPHPLKGKREGQFALNLAGGWQVVGGWFLAQRMSPALKRTTVASIGDELQLSASNT